MTGWAATYHFNTTAPVDRDALCRMRDAMKSRAPKEAGDWVSEDGRVGLAARRWPLFSDNTAAAQPMHSYDHRYRVVFDGAITNYLTLKQHLYDIGYRFFSSSDTEVVMCAYHRWGHRMLHKLRGAFSLAIWDAHERRFFAARDPFGQRPLYYSATDQALRAASAINALLADGSISRAPSLAGTAGFFLWGTIPEPLTHCDAISSLRPGTYLVADDNGVQAPTTYWSGAALYRDTCAQNTDEAEASYALRTALLRATSRALTAFDTRATGVLLSADPASSAILAMASEAQPDPVRTVTLCLEGCDRGPNSLAQRAERIAAFYGAQHTTVTLSRTEFRNGLEDMVDAMDQPMAGHVSSWFVARAAAQAGLQTVLTGAGSDAFLGASPAFARTAFASFVSVPTRIPGLAPAMGALLDGLSTTDRFTRIRRLNHPGSRMVSAYFAGKGLFMPWELSDVMGSENVQAALGAYRPLDDAQAHIGRGHPFCHLSALWIAFDLIQNKIRHFESAAAAHRIDIRLPFADVDLATAMAAVIPGLWSPFNTRRLLINAMRPLLPSDWLKPRDDLFARPLRDWLAAQHASLRADSPRRAWAKIVHQRAGAPPQ
ncbi:MAG: asparagine synthetase B [Proteobacteria bacterium]|nr:asparagine synthetase B [Pseudomonadota bacterium]